MSRCLMNFKLSVLKFSLSCCFGVGNRPMAQDIVTWICLLDIVRHTSMTIEMGGEGNSNTAVMNVHTWNCFMLHWVVSSPGCSQVVHEVLVHKCMLYVPHLLLESSTWVSCTQANKQTSKADADVAVKVQLFCSCGIKRGFHRSTWEDNNKYFSAQKGLESQRVVSDVVAERGIALIQSFNCVLNNEAEQNQFCYKLLRDTTRY